MAKLVTKKRVSKKNVDIMDYLAKVRKDVKEYKKELRIIEGVLVASKGTDVRHLYVGKKLVKKGFVSPLTGKITKKGLFALESYKSYK